MNKDMINRDARMKKNAERTFKIRVVASFLLINLLTQICFPTVAMALTSGPAQPESMGFEPITTNQMVDLFSGDFTYNIPLFNLPGKNGGYPFNMAYHSGVGMDDEASWVGLGWSLTPGAINRDVRGIADDHNGDPIYETIDMMDNTTIGGSMGLSLELFGADVKKGLGWDLGVNFKMYHNSYKGLGGGLGLNTGLAFGNRSNHFKTSISTGLDTQGGADVGANISLSRGNHCGDGTVSYSFGASISGASGLALNLGLSGRNKADVKAKGERGSVKKFNYGGSSSITFSNAVFAPSIEYKTNSRNITGSYSVGGATAGALIGTNYSVFWSEEGIKYKNKRLPHKGFGYMYLEDAKDEDLVDFQREKDGVASKEMSNLPSSQLTYDVYSVSGQGMSTVYRPYRSDYGHVRDGHMENFGFGGALGGDVGVGTDAYWGLSGSFNWSYNSSGDWKNENALYDVYKFGNKYGTLINGGPDHRQDYENVYFKSHGESSFMKKDEWDKIYGNKAIKAEIIAQGDHASGEVRYDESMDLYDPIRNRWEADADRVKRNTGILTLKNEDLLGVAANNLGEYKVKYYTSVSNYSLNNLTTEFDRNQNKASSAPTTDGAALSYSIKKHIGAITTTNADGLRYNYALPTYNITKREYTYSYDLTEFPNCSRSMPVVTDASGRPKHDAANTDKFYKRTEYPAFAHTYLLTSILGTDYVDVTGDGPSDDDYGYWVKFNYVKADDNYAWRAPYAGAQKGRGSAITKLDDKATFQYGEKEIWYVATVESSTHVAVFNLSVREDAKGVSKEFQNDEDAKGASLYKLDRIDLYTKEEYKKTGTKTPIQSVHFVYDYSLCKNVPNNTGHVVHADWNGDGKIDGIELERNDNMNKGKLTLRRVYFTYQNNTRGRLSPYEFNYDGLNPTYSQENYDRWGNYKEYSQGQCDREQFPYVDQTVSKTTADQWASAWHLTEIKLPSGGSIQVDYESDDYAYVQHKEATQLFKIEKLGWADIDASQPARVFNSKKEGSPKEWFDNAGELANSESRRVYFKLEQPIAVISDGNARKKVLKEQYLNGLKIDASSNNYQLYFKIKSKIKDGIYDYVSGYCDLDMTDNRYDFADEVNGYYTSAFVSVKSIPVDFWNTGTKYYHPFAFAGWQHMKGVKPELITEASATLVQNSKATSPGVKAPSDQELLLLAKKISASFSHYAVLFKGFTGRCFDKNFCSEIDLSSSYVKLNSPDRIKFGGGSRVRKVIINDQWGDVDTEKSELVTYGQVYEYTKTEKGQVISSGVASYEPIIGGDENALHYAKAFKKDRMFNVDEMAFTEYPIMEQYFPGASVGYSKVTVKSIASENAIDNIGSNGVPINTKIADRAKSGVVVNEFYTYKDFPVIVKETQITKDPDATFIPIPFVGMIRNNDLTASQGYCIQLNDMHGKPSKVTTYAQKANGEVNEDRIVSQVTYEYRANKTVYQGKEVFELNNELDGDEVLVDGTFTEPDIDGKMKVKRASGKYMLGVEYDYFSDMRRQYSNQGQAGVDFNSGGVFFFLPWLSFWPSFSVSSNDYKSICINKVIHQSGIMRRTVATDGQSSVSTETKLYDLETGAPVLTVVKNNYNSDVYNYSIPSHWNYEGMGSAYSNIGYEFQMSVLDKAFAHYHINTFDELRRVLKPGDELLVDNGIERFRVTVEDVPAFGNIQIVDSQTKLNANQVVKAKVVRSGKRNLLSANSGNIVALKNPTKDITREDNQSFVFSDQTWYAEFMQLVNDQLIANGQYIKEGSFSNSQLGSLGYSQLANSFLNIQVKYSGKTAQLLAQNGTPSIHSGNLINAFFTLNDGSVVYFPSFSVKVAAPVVALQAGNFVTTFGVNQPSPQPFIAPFTFYYYKIFIHDVLQSSAIEMKDMWGGFNTGGFVDLYKNGSKGIWRPLKNYYYKDDRYSQQEKSMAPNNELSLSTDGVFQGELDNTQNYDKRFYMFDWRNPANTAGRWVSNQTITKYNSDGFEIENEDILGIKSSAKYGYGGALVTMVAANAAQDEIAFESFEDNISSIYSSSALSLESHTGKYSSKNATVILNNAPILALGKKYVVSMWIKQPANIDPNSSAIEIRLCDGVGSDWAGVKLYPSGNVIEGWQRVEGIVTAPVSNGFGVKVYNQTNVLVDDIRVAPFDGAITSYVYDPLTFRLQATLDNNNYATFYYYDEQGNLHLTKRETANGVFTVSENRGHIKEKY